MTTKESTPAVVSQVDRPSARSPFNFKRHDGLLAGHGGCSERDQWSTRQILDLLPMLPNWPSHDQRAQRTIASNAHRILDWLGSHPGEGWQDRWLSSGADQNLDWLAAVTTTDAARTATTDRADLMAGLASLLLCRIVLPSYQFLTEYRACKLFSYAAEAFRPDLFERLDARSRETGMRGRQFLIARTVISKMVLHTGRDIDQLTGDDLLTFRAFEMRRKGKIGLGVAVAWPLLRGVANLGEHLTLKDAVRYGQRSTSELVDAYRPQCKAVRDIFIRYLDERRPSLDYSSFGQLVGHLVGRFWSDIEYHHPGLDTLHIPRADAEAWKHRLRVVVKPDGTTRPRKDYRTILIQVRSFYLDLQEWALQDPSWAQWSVPSPVRKGDTAGLMKAKHKTTAEMHQRTRDRLPLLPVLVEAAERHKDEQAELLAAAGASMVGQTFEHAGHEYRRTVANVYSKPQYRNIEPPLQIEDVATGQKIDIIKNEDEAFKAWAVIEVLRHTGVRNEELLEISHLGLISYRLPDTGEVVPMLQIVPSKGNQERLLLVGPELASVLASIITRLRNENGGSVPLTARYDGHEREMGPPLPHLFQHRLGEQWRVPSPNTIQKRISQTLVRTGLKDSVGRPLRYTPHDFRRMFATEAVTGGLPVHIVARLLGHANINTTQAYMAVFDEELVRTYRVFLDKRRAARPEAEYRQPTDEEWREFQQHFQTRKLELGECGRPYGTPCKHEHACIRCPSLRLDPSARPRLVSIIANLNDRVQEARINGWLGEVQGLQHSLETAAGKLVALDRMRNRQPGPVGLGMPIITTTD